MRRLALITLMLACAGVAFAQKPVHVVLVPVFDHITPPPTTARGAYGRIDCTGVERGGKCSAEKIFKSVDDTLTAASNLLNAQIDKNAPPPGMSKDMAAKMNDKDFQKKMKNMSDEEKMKMAMEMSKNMSMQPQMYTAETPAVQEAVNEASNIAQKTGTEISTIGPRLQAEAKRKETLEKNHAVIDQWSQDEEKKIPQLSTGEMSYPEPKAYKALQLKTIDKHIALVDDELKTLAGEWRKDRGAMKATYAPFETKMAKIHFGVDAKNPASQVQLANTQRGLIETLAKLSARSKTAFEDAAAWYAKKVTIENKTY